MASYSAEDIRRKWERRFDEAFRKLSQTVLPAVSAPPMPSFSAPASLSSRVKPRKKTVMAQNIAPPRPDPVPDARVETAPAPVVRQPQADEPKPEPVQPEQSLPDGGMPLPVTEYEARPETTEQKPAVPQEGKQSAQEGFDRLEDEMLRLNDSSEGQTNNDGTNQTAS